MKRILSFVLVTALLLGICGVTAFATDGDQTTPTTGPADSTFIYGGARCGIYDTHTNKSTNVVVYDYDLTEVAAHNDAIPGMTYDMESNTLTVKDVHQRDNQLYIWYMGNDFKLNVEGENEFGIIYVYNYFNFHGTSLNIVGSGTLTVNEQLINDDAIHMYADGEDPLMGLDIADSVTVHLYSNTPEGEEDPAPVVSLGRTVTAPAEGAITVGGKKLPEAKSEQIKFVDCDYVPAAKVEDPDEDISSGLQVRSKTDPDGVYSVGQMDGSYIVRRWIYLESLDIWTYDRSFADKGLVGKRYKKADFEAEYDYVIGMAPAHVDYMSAYTLSWRGTEGTKMTNDDDAGAVYIGVPTGGVWDWGDDYRGNYEIHRVVWDSNQEMYVEDTSFKAIDLMESKLEENGFHIVREEVYEPLKLTVWTTENPDDDGRFDITAPVMKRESDPEGIYVQIGTYGYDGKSEGVTVFKVHYNPVTEEHYVMYYDHDYNGTEFFLVPNADIENGTADFSYDGEMVTKQIHERFLSGNYNIDYDLTYAVQLKKTDEPDAVYAYRSWTHIHADDTQEEMYGIMRLQYNEKLGCYVEDTDFDEVVTNDLGKLEYMGYEVILSEQPLEYYTKGRLSLSEYPAYTDQNGTAYYADYNDNVYSYSDDHTITIDGTVFYLGTYEPDVDISDLNDTEHEILTNTYRYWIEGPEYHHIGEEQEYVEYPLWVNGERLNSDRLRIPCGNGVAIYDPAKKTLTLDNVEITKGTDTDWTNSGVLSQMDQLTVVIKGNCTITETGGDGIGTYNSESYQVGDVIYPAPYDLTVTGDGTLTIVESTPVYGYGLYCTGDLVLDGVTLNITSAAAGVWASDLKMNNITADIQTSSWYSGIVVNRGNFTFDDSTVTAKSGEGAGLLLGSDADSSTLTVSSGALNLEGKLGVQGIVDKSVVTVNGGKLAINATDAAFDASFLADDAKNIVMGEGIGVTSGAIDGNAVVIEECAASAGFAVSGTATSYLTTTGEGNDVVTLKLTGTDNNHTDSVDVTAEYSSEKVGAKAETAYSFENVPAGSYVLSVEKKNHVTREYEVTVSADTTQDVVICPKGDANNDGSVKGNDATVAYRHALGKAPLTDDYKFACANVAGNDSVVKGNDATAIYRHALGKKSLFE